MIYDLNQILTNNHFEKSNYFKVMFLYSIDLKFDVLSTDIFPLVDNLYNFSKRNFLENNMLINNPNVIEIISQINQISKKYRKDPD